MSKRTKNIADNSSNKKQKHFAIGDGDISDKFLTKCENEFKQDPLNIITRNSVNAIGSLLSTMNSNRIQEISHIFHVSVKRPHVRATNQGASGRCWIFAALNMFRHILINALNLENFEFSEVYLFFWDKFERSNTYIRWFIEHPDANPGDRAHDYMVMDFMGDGGWWNMLTALVKKYGLVPMTAMKETYQSDDSDDMNKIIKEQLDSCVNHICKNRGKLTVEQQHKIREETMTQIYKTLVKFLGEPPKKFDWHFLNEDNEPMSVINVDPRSFYEMVAIDIDMERDFVVLAHIPSQELKNNQNYRIKYTNNIAESNPCVFFNTDIDELSKYAIKSISKGMAVWIAGDVSKSFNWFHSALDDKLDDHKTVFGETYKFEKGDRITMRNVMANHAMCLTGYNLDENGKIISWQCENSWGFIDHNIPGLDGFLYMSHSWFKKYVMMICVHKNILSRSFRKKINSPAIDLDPWDSMAPAKTDGKGVPEGYRRFIEKKMLRH